MDLSEIFPMIYINIYYHPVTFIKFTYMHLYFTLMENI